MKRAILLLLVLLITLGGCIPTTTPVAPSNLQGSATSSSSISLNWKDNSNNESGFKIYRSILNTNLFEIATVGTNITSFQDTNLDEKTRYYYQVCAFNDTGKSQVSNLVSVTTGEATGTVTGQIVGQNNLPISGIKVKLDELIVVTGSDGQFSLTGITPGTYELSAEGGSLGHYLLKTQNITIHEGSNPLGALTAYQILGAGVIMQSEINTAALQPSAKKIDLTQFSIAPKTGETMSASLFSKAVSECFLNENISFFLLTWEPVNNAAHYQINYIPAGTTAQNIWNSTAAHPEDPAYSSTDPHAYLDLSSELAGIITSPGVYTFEIVGLNTAGNIVTTLPPISLSLGMHLPTYPINIAVNENQLSWNAVAEAEKYKAKLFEGESLVNTSDFLTSTVYTLPDSLVSDTYYKCQVEAWAFDFTGWVNEITVGRSGFVW